MTNPAACHVDLDVAAELDAARPRNRLINVTVVLREDLVPKPPLTSSKLNGFHRLVDELLDRAADAQGEGMSVREYVDGRTVDPLCAMFVLSARARFIDALLAQPEVVACRNGFAYSFRCDPQPATLE